MEGSKNEIGEEYKKQETGNEMKIGKGRQKVEKNDLN